MIFTADKQLKDIIYIQPTIHGDDRGYFFESYHIDRFKHAGIHHSFVQVNQSFSQNGILRGLHFQKAPHEQAKLVKVVDGCIFDVAVDIRQTSPTFGQWTGYTLSANKHDMLFIPEGFAHGFYVVSPTATIMYHCSAVYAPSHEVSIRYDDPDIGIKWPYTSTPILSKKDQNGQFLRDYKES